MKILPIALVCLVAGTAAAGPTLDPFDAGPFIVSLPKGWKVEHDGAVVVAHQDPARKDAAAFLFAMQPAQGSEEQTLETIVNQIAKDVRISRREAANGGHVLVADGIAEGVEVRLGALAVTVDKVVVFGVVVSKVAEFDSLGGLELVASVLGSVRLPGAAPAPAPAPRPAPTIENGKLQVPPPSRPLTVADLVGEWKHDDSVLSHYVSTTTGGYAGYSAISVKETWTITAKGVITVEMWATTADRGGARQIHESGTGTITVAPDGTVTVAVKGRATEKFLIRGWSVGPALIVLKLNGTYYDDIPADIRNDPHKGFNLDQYWVHKAPPR